MLTRVKQLWELPESAATDESVFLKRRQLCQAIAAGPILLGSTAGGAATAWAAAAGDPTADLYPVKRNERYTIARRKLTEEKYAITYNNFYEFGSHKRIAKAAQKLKIRPWTVTFDGLVEKQMAVDFDTLIRHMPLEERLYRFRCVEAFIELLRTCPIDDISQVPHPGTADLRCTTPCSHGMEAQRIKCPAGANDDDKKLLIGAAVCLSINEIYTTIA